MGWITFQEKAKKISPRLYFIKNNSGFEVWEKGVVLGEDGRDYCCMRLPHEILERPGFHWNKMLEVLKRMDKCRRENRQLEQVREMRAKNEEKQAASKKLFLDETQAFFKDHRKAFVKFREEQGITKSSVKARMEGSEDEVKKEIHKKFDEA